MEDFIHVSERLAPHLAWPIIALIALVVVCWRLSSVNKLYEMVYSDEGKKISTFIIEANDRLDGLKLKLEDMLKQSQALTDQVRGLDEASIASTSERIADIAGAQDVAAKDQGVINHEDMFRRMLESWTNLRESMRAKFDELELDGDLRSLGTIAYKLGDGRRRNPLTDNDVKLMATLHSQYKRFTRLQATKEDWLTHDIYKDFVSAIEGLIPKIQGVGVQAAAAP